MLEGTAPGNLGCLHRQQGVGQGWGTEGQAASAVGWSWGQASAQTEPLCAGGFHSSVSSPGLRGTCGEPGLLAVGAEAERPRTKEAVRGQKMTARSRPRCSGFEEQPLGVLEEADR